MDGRAASGPDKVCAVVRGGAGEVPAAQTVPPAATVAHGGSWHDALAEALSHDARWYWLLEGGVRPDPAALERLLAALRGAGDLPRPVLLASRVVDEAGRLHPSSAPWSPLLDRVRVIDAARRRLVSLRLARWGSLLVSAEAVERHGLPRRDFAGGADDLEWTARMLRDDPGYLVPGSVAVRTGPAPALSPAEVRDRLRMLRGDGWVAQEPVWFGYVLAVEAGRDLRRRPRPSTVGRLARGAGQALRAGAPAESRREGRAAPCAPGRARSG